MEAVGDARVVEVEAAGGAHVVEVKVAGGVRGGCEGLR
jgi:hypothetical protein